MTFEYLHSDAYAPDKPYSTRLLKQTANNSSWVREQRGSHTTLSLEAKTQDLDEYVHERPFVSVNGEAAFLRIPYWVNQGLESLRFRFYCRVSNGELDSTNGETTLMQDDVYLYAHFEEDVGNSAKVHVRPMRVAGGVAEWGVVDLEYTPEDLGVLGAGQYATLGLSMRSETPFDRGHPFGTKLPSSSYRGRVGSSKLDTGVSRSTIRVKADAADFYDNGGTSSAPDGGLEIMATALGWRPNLLSDTQNYLRGWVDHLMGASDSQSMYCWTRNPDLLLDGHEESGFNMLYKWYVPYIQFRAIEIWEVYE